jgi:hypothetical protein
MTLPNAPIGVELKKASDLFRRFIDIPYTGKPMIMIVLMMIPLMMMMVASFDDDDNDSSSLGASTQLGAGTGSIRFLHGARSQSMGKVGR